MRTREELAETIAVTLRGEDQFGYTDISDLSDAVLDSRYDLLAVADAVPRRLPAQASHSGQHRRVA